MGDIADLMDGLWLPCESIPLVCDLDSRKVMTVYELNCKGSKWNCIDYPRLTKKSSLKLLLTNENLIYSYNRPYRNRLGGKHKLFMSESEMKAQEEAIAKALEGDRLHKTINEDLERMEVLFHPERKYFPIDPRSATAQALGFDPRSATAQALHKTPLEEALDKATAYDSLYGESARSALEAFDSGLGSQEIFKSIHDYIGHTDRILLDHLSVTQAIAVLPFHQSIIDSASSRLIELNDNSDFVDEEEDLGQLYDKTPEEYAKAIEDKDKEIAELKALLEKARVQEKEVVKRTRENQLHNLIWKIDCAISVDEDKPAAIHVWNELENNYLEHDEEGIIQNISGGVIEWRSVHGNPSSLALTSFNKTLSKIRKKFQNQ